MIATPGAPMSALEKRTHRLFFMDYLRVGLVTLVVLHHLAVVYGANTGFYYLEPARHDLLALVVLVLFQLFNQAYFMGLLFLIAGYFTPGSLDRKGPALYLKHRLLRLGVPTLIFTFILAPISSIGIYQMPATLTHMTTPFTWEQYPRLIGIGPMWFAVMLLVFDCGYAAWLTVRKSGTDQSKSMDAPSYGMIGVLILALALTSYLIRIVLPLGKYVLWFPSLAYLPQYVSFFLIGVAAYRRNWLRTIGDPMGKRGFWLAAIATLILLPLALIGKLGKLGGFLGNGHWQSSVYTLWDSTFAVGISLGLISLFQRRFDYPARLGQFMERQAFAVYVIHIPVIVLLALALRPIHIEQLLKFGLAAIIGVPLSFAVAYLVRRISVSFQQNWL
jgi:hypothetical protein